MGHKPRPETHVTLLNLVTKKLTHDPLTDCQLWRFVLSLSGFRVQNQQNKVHVA